MLNIRGEIIIHLECEYKNTSVRILSCEQIIGSHIRVLENFGDFINRIKVLAADPRYNYRLIINNDFTVMASNSIDLTHHQNGRSRWCLIRCARSPIQKTSFLLMGERLWGVEFSSGLRLKKSLETHKKEEIEFYLKEQIRSILESPQRWREYVEVYTNRMGPSP